MTHLDPHIFLSEKFAQINISCRFKWPSTCTYDGAVIKARKYSLKKEFVFTLIYAYMQIKQEYITAFAEKVRSMQSEHRHLQFSRKNRYTANKLTTSKP